MFLAELIFALLMAVLFTLIFAVGLRRRGPWASLWAFFLVVFLAAWAGGLWISPAGPMFVGIYWLPMILVAFVFAILLAGVGGPASRGPKVETISEVKEQETAAERAFDVFFWVLLISLILIIVLGYLVPEEEVIVVS
jgi:hypothetical protein